MITAYYKEKIENDFSNALIWLKKADDDDDISFVDYSLLIDLIRSIYNSPAPN